MRLWIASRSLSLGARSRGPLAPTRWLAMTLMSGGDFRQRCVERRGRARQILEHEAAIGRLLLRFRRGRANLGHRLSIVEQGLWCDHVKLMGFDGLILEQKDAQRDDILAAPI